MEIIFEILFYLFAEVLLAFIGEGIAELGLESLARAIKGKGIDRSFGAFWYVILGAALGFVSLWFIPRVSGSSLLPIFTFIVSPLASGLGLCVFSWIINHGINEQRFFQPSKFLYGAVFALAFSTMRWIAG
jgi:hypothetical protein